VDLILCRVSGTGTAALPMPLTRHKNSTLFLPGVLALRVSAPLVILLSRYRGELHLSNDR